MPNVRVNGVRLHYEEFGEGDAILGLHGTGSSAMLWETSVAPLSALGRVILYDRRGSTRSERPEPFQGGVERHAEDAAALLRALDAGPAIVIGRSYGGAVAILLALRHPDLVRGLALLEAFIGSLDPEAEAWEAELAAQLDLVAEVSNEAVAEVLIEYALGEGAWASFPAELQAMFADNAVVILDEERDPPALEAAELAKISVPTLVVEAEESDPRIHRVSGRIAEGIPGSRKASVGGGHMIDPGHPDVVAFVRELTSGA